MIFFNILYNLIYFMDFFRHAYDFFFMKSFDISYNGFFLKQFKQV